MTSNSKYSILFLALILVCFINFSDSLPTTTKINTHSTSSSSSSSSSSLSKYLYSIGSSLTYGQGDQTLLIVNPSNNQVLTNQSLSIPYEILNILSNDEETSSLLLFCIETSSSKNLLISLNYKTFQFQEIGGAYGGYVFKYANQPFVFTGGNVFMPAHVPFYDATGLTVLHWNFTGGSFNIIDLPISDFNVNSTVRSLTAYDSKQSLLYITYQSTYEQDYNMTSVVTLNPLNPNQTSSHAIYSGISNLNPDYIHLLYVNPLDSVLYALTKNSKDSSISICSVDFKGLTCDNLFNKDMGAFYDSFKYTPFFLNNEKTELVLLEFLEKNEKPMINFQSVNINNWVESETNLINNYWSSTFGFTYNTWSFFSYF